VNILLVNWQDRLNPQAGGAEIHLFEIFRRLASAGHRIRLVCSGWPGARPREVVDGIEVHRTGGRHSFAVRGRGAVRRALRQEVPDVVVEDINKLPLYLPTLTPLPFAVIVPHLFGTTAFAEASWPMAATVVLAERAIPRVYRRASFHVISESTRDDLVGRGISPAAIAVIHPGVDTVALRPDPALDRTDPPSFLYVGRLRRYKGVDVAIEALVLARRSRPDLRLVIAGSGADRPRLEALARQRGVAEAVAFAGFVTDAEKIRLLRTTWANIFPSPKEGWGITIMEAAACGTPSIASDSPGLRDSVRHGETGILVPHGDPGALARQLVAFAADRALVERLGRAARRHAETHTWEVAAEASLQHLQATIGARAPHAIL
jgi:glycosyltransferase involved in cell wall biosynthesis